MDQAKRLRQIINEIGLAALIDNLKVCGVEKVGKNIELPEWGFSVKINPDDLTFCVVQFKVP